MKHVPLAKPNLGKYELEYVTESVKSGWISSAGHYIKKFESEFAKYFHVKYASSCSNGTAALHLALLALGIAPGDEVLVPALTFVATANVVRYMNAVPIFVDIRQDTWNIDPEKIPARITPKTKAIIVVHLYGYPADMDKILSLARKYKLSVIEDAAEAHGAKFKNKFVGTLGDIGCYSFYGNKIITTGEGGMVVSNHKQLIEKVIFFKNHAMSTSRKYYHPSVGYNYRMTNLQAAVGLAQIEKLDQILRVRRQIEQTYKKALKHIPEIVLQPSFQGRQSVCWLFSLRITSEFGKSRNQLVSFLDNKGIDSRPFFIPLPQLPMYKNSGVFPITNAVADSGINLPTFVGLTQNQIGYIASVINQCHKQSKNE